MSECWQGDEKIETAGEMFCVDAVILGVLVGGLVSGEMEEIVNNVGNDMFEQIGVGELTLSEINEDRMKSDGDLNADLQHDKLEHSTAFDTVINENDSDNTVIDDILSDLDRTTAVPIVIMSNSYAKVHLANNFSRQPKQVNISEEIDVDKIKTDDKEKGLRNLTTIRVPSK